MKRITKKPWFGPKKYGWGWTPISVEGWVVFAILIAIVIFIVKSVPDDPRNIYYILGLVAVFSVLCYITSGPPGSTFFKKWK